VALARRTAARLGLGAGDEQAVAALVGEECDLALSAVHVDLQDEEQVLNLAARLGSPERARAAYLLALAEQGEAGQWEDWRRGRGAGHQRPAPGAGGRLAGDRSPPLPAGAPA